MSKTIGIDLGTTNSCVAVMEGGNVVVIPNTEGSRTTPSVVAFTQNGDRLIGQVAKRQAITNAEYTIYAVKRFIGRRFTDPDTQIDAKRVPYRIVDSERGDAYVQVRDKQCSPSEISSYVLQRMKDIAEEYLGEPIDKAVITVPAYFNDNQRQATRDAARLAGMQVERMINEPTAAALAYGIDKQTSQKIAVYDMGGGTFDISILELSDGVFNVLATNGDTHLGGEDFDQLLIDTICQTFQSEHGFDLRQDKIALQRVKEAAERAKHELSSTLSTEINLPFIAANEEGPKHLQLNLTRADYEAMAAPLLERSLEPCRKCLADAAIEVEAIGEVLLVGGMTRMPKLQQMVAAFFGRNPNREINPDEVVAIGAAVQGAVLTGDVKNVLLLDVTPLSLGVETAGGVMTALIPRNTTVPSRKRQVFSTAKNNQAMVEVHVLQGERPMASDNHTLAMFTLEGIPPAPRGVPQIEVEFAIDANGCVQVKAKDLGSGKEQQVTITGKAGLTEQEINTILQQAAEQKAADDQRFKRAELLQQAEGLLYSTEQLLSSLGEQLDKAKSQTIAELTEQLQQALKQPEGDGLQVAFDALQKATHELTAALYPTPLSS